jgi:predicted polyphosphate/ATP-dependent NAD kinase
LENILVIATEGKLRNLKSLRVDTGDPKLDDAFRARKVKVMADYRTEYMMNVE